MNETLMAFSVLVGMIAIAAGSAYGIVAFQSKKSNRIVGSVTSMMG